MKEKCDNCEIGIADPTLDECKECINDGGKSVSVASFEEERIKLVGQPANSIPLNIKVCPICQRECYFTYGVWKCECGFKEIPKEESNL